MARKALSSVDHAWLRMEHPTNLMMITGVLTFDAPLEYERVRETLESRLLRFDRFRQRVVEPRLRSPHWETVPDFDIRNHLHKVTLPAPGDQAALQKIVSHYMSTPLDMRKPLWDFHLIEQYGTGGALIGRLHHSIGDGIALIRVLLSLTDDTPEAAAPPPEEPPRKRRRRGPVGALLHRAAKAARTTRRVTETMRHESIEITRNPERLLDLAKLSAKVPLALGKLTLRPSDPKTIFKGRLGVFKTAAWSEDLSLADVKAVGRITGGTVNDVLLTAMSGGLRRYLLERGEAVEGLNFRAVVPVNLRPVDEPIKLGNKFGLVFLSLPVGIADSLDRLYELKRRMDELKNSPEAVVAFGILNAIGMGPKEVEDIVVTIFGTKATTVMTNVPGPRQQIYLAGSPMRDLMFWVPQSGKLGMGISIISYNGKVNLGVVTDAKLVADPERIIAGFHEEFEEMMDLVRQVQADEELSVDETPAPEAAPQPDALCQGTTKAGQQCRKRPRPGEAYCYLHREK